MIKKYLVKGKKIAKMQKMGIRKLNLDIFSIYRIGFYIKLLYKIN